MLNLLSEVSGAPMKGTVLNENDLERNKSYIYTEQLMFFLKKIPKL